MEEGQAALVGAGREGEELSHSQAVAKTERTLGRRNRGGVAE